MNRRLLPALSLVTGAIFAFSVVIGAADEGTPAAPGTGGAVECRTTFDRGFVATIEDRSNDKGFVATAVDISNDSGFLQLVDPSTDGGVIVPCPTLTPLPGLEP